LVIDSPHSGMEWPADFRPLASRAAILSTWDALVDELWAGAPDVGATLLAARFPRAYVDVNRAATDIDAEILDAPWPGPVSATDYTRRGMGLIRRYALPGVPMYDRKLSVAEVRLRLESCYQPYRDALRRVLDDLHLRHGVVWHVDCHSMKSRGNEMNIDSGEARPDFVVSDRMGTTCDPEFTSWTAEFLRGLGYSVQINDPYKGGDLVAAFGAPSRRRHSLQIEVNRARYLDEAACERGIGFASAQASLTRYLAAAVAWIRTHSA
jgi:N-formylglutamate deformylase